MGVIWNGSYPWRWAGDLRWVPAHVVSALVEPPATELFTLDEAKLRANLTWPANDPRDAQMNSFIRAARNKVELDTHLSLLEQTRVVYFDAVPYGGVPYGYAPSGSVIVLPAQSMPLQEVVSIETVDAASGAVSVLDPASYVVDYVSGRIALAAGARWPSNVRPFQGWAITLVAGWPDVETLDADAPLLRHAAGLLLAHYATVGRDLAITGTIVTANVQGYAEMIAPYQPVTVA